MNKTYCSAAFKHIYADNGTRYRLCCHAGENDTLKKYNTNNTLPFDYFLSPEMEEIRNKMFAGEKIHGCEECYKIEERGGYSWRFKKFLDKYGIVQDVERINLKLRFSGSLCNLGCYMCKPYNSSTRRKEMNQTSSWNFWDDVEPVPYVPIAKERFDEIRNHILENIDQVDSMNITGGEPMIMPKLWKFLDDIPEDHAKRIHINVDTNLTVLGRVFDLVNKFKSVNLNVSCDHYGDKLAWIRYPINVKEFEKNLISARGIISRINCTVSILNVKDLFDIIDYYKDNFGIIVDITNAVTAPTSLSIRNLPQEEKDELIEKYKDYQTILQELEKPRDEKDLQKGYEYCRSLERNRDIKLIEIFNI